MTATAPGFFARLAARLKAALRAEPCPCWTDYLHQKSRDGARAR